MQETVLPNGLKVLVVEDHAFPVFSSMMFYRVGSRNENLGETGLSHLVEHMLFQKVGKFRKGEIGATIARNGGMFNGFTSDDFTVFFETMAASKLDLALKIESERMRQAVFTQEELQTEIKRIDHELDQEAKDAANLLVKEVRSSAFQLHPYKNPTIGWRNDLEKLTLDDAKRHYREYYQPGNATLVIVGDISAKNALAQVRRHFGSIAAAEPPRSVRVVEPQQRAERRVFMKYGGSSEIVATAYHVPGFVDSDTAALAVLEKVLLSGVGGRIRTKLIDAKVLSSARATLEVKRDPSLFMINMTAPPGVSAQKAIEALDGLLEQIKSNGVSDSELRRARNHAEFQLLSERDGPYKNAFQLGYFESLDSWKAASTWSSRLAGVSPSDIQRVAKRYFTTENRVVGILSNPGAKPVKKVEKSSDEKKSDKGDKKAESKADKGSVKKTDKKSGKKDDKKSTKKNEKKSEQRKEKPAKDSGKKHHAPRTAVLKPAPVSGLNLSAYSSDAATSSTTSSGAKLKKRLLAQSDVEASKEQKVESLKASENGSSDASTSTSVSVSAPTAASNAPAPKQSEVTAKTDKKGANGASSISKAVLKNGLTVVVLESKLCPAVQIYGAVKAGEAFEPVGKRGVSQLLCQLMNEGSSKYSENQCETIQDELGLVPASMLRFEAGPQWISFQARCLSRDTAQLVQLLTSRLRDPLIKDESVDGAKERVISHIEHGQSVEARVDRAMMQGLIAPNTSFYPLEPMDQGKFVSNLKASDVRDFHQQAVKPDAVTIVFVGDISLADAVSCTQKAMADNNFSGKSTAKRVLVQHNPRRLLKNSMIIEHRLDSMVALGRLIDTGLGAEDYPLLLLADCALTNHPIFSRFAQKISGEITLASSLSLEDLASDVEPLPGTTVWSMNIPVANNTLPVVVRSIQTELRKFSKQGLTPDEYSEVRLYMNGALPVRWMGSGALAAHSILDGQVLSDKCDPLPDLLSGIKSSSLDSVNKFIRNTFKPDRASLVIAATKQAIGQVHGLKKEEGNESGRGD